MFDIMYSIVFNVLIKLFKGLSTLDPNKIDLTLSIDRVIDT